MSQFMDISTALDAHLLAMPSLPPVAWENDEYEPTKGALWIQQTLLPNDTVGGTLGVQANGGNDMVTGIYWLNVFAPAGDNTGKKTAFDMADAIADYFRVDSLTYNGRKVEIVSISQGAASNGKAWFMVPVKINYLSITAKR